MNRSGICLLLLGTLAVAAFGEKKPPKKQEPAQLSPLDQYIQEAHRRAASATPESPGSLFAAPAAFTDLATDVRARRVDDTVTIVVNEQASAVSTGQTKTSRASSANAGLTSAAGKFSIPARLSNIVTANSTSSLDGQGTTSRTTTLATTITARVVDVLPNGNLVIEGSKSLLANSENQVITIRGVVRPTDLSNANTVLSGSVAQMELKINGKGVVNDAIRRPNFLYRLLLGLMPF